MARQRTFLSDYNPMRKAFPYVLILDDGTIEHAKIYAHDIDDAVNRLVQRPGIKDLKVFPAF